MILLDIRPPTHATHGLPAGNDLDALCASVIYAPGHIRFTCGEVRGRGSVCAYRGDIWFDAYRLGLKCPPLCGGPRVSMYDLVLGPSVIGLVPCRTYSALFDAMKVATVMTSHRQYIG